jgi:heme O synthase-like polyprenyltransferase
MNQGHSQASRSLHAITLIVVLAAAYFLASTVDENPERVRIASIAMIVLGVISLIAGSLKYNQYREVFDHEPAALFGRPSTGGSIRGFYSVFIYGGAWSLLGGIFLAVFLTLLQ